MATKSVIEIDVLDEKFKAFVDVFEKYQAALKKMPSDWQKVNAAANQSSATVAKNIGQAAKSQKDLNKALVDSNYGFSNMAKLSGDIAKNLASGALSLAKWVSYGALGGYGAMTGLAARASSMRSQAQGLGISTGSLRAANVNLGRFISPEGVLGNIADVQADLSRGQILSRLGGKQGQDPAEMLGTVMKTAVSMFKQGGKTSQYAEAMGLTQIFSLEELRRLSSLSEEELQKTIKAYEKDRQMLSVSDADSRSWQEFWVQVKRSSNQLEKSLLNNLVKLTPLLEKFTKQVFTLVDEALGSDALKNAIEKFTNYLASPEFKENVETFIEALKRLGEATVNVAKFFGLIDKSKEEKAREKASVSDINVLRGEVTGTNESMLQKAKDFIKNRPFIATGKEQSELGALEKKYGLPTGMLDAVWKTESSRGKNMISPAGALGHFQFMPKTAAEFNLKDPFNFGESANAAARKLQGLMKYYKNDPEKALAAYNWGEGNLNKLIARSGNEWRSGLPQETKDYLTKNSQLIVTVNTSAGSDINVSAKGLPR